MGGRITKLSHHQGFAASTGGSIMVFTASLLGIPVSTTHTITGSIIGAGVARRASAVRWGVAGNVVVAWFLPIPASPAVAALFYSLTRLFLPILPGARRCSPGSEERRVGEKGVQ